MVEPVKGAAMKANQKAFSLILGILAALLIFAPSTDAHAGQPAAVPAHALNRQSSGPDAQTVIVIPAAAFHSDGAYAFNDTFFTFSGGYIRGNDTNHYGCVETGVVLPDNVYLIGMYASIYDNDPDYSHHVRLFRKARTTGAVVEMITINSSGSSTSIQSLWEPDTLQRITSNPEYAYYITDCLSSSELRLYSVRIWYDPVISIYIEPESYLPTIRR